MSDDNTAKGLTSEHREYLTSQAVDVQLAERLGVRSLTSKVDARDLGGVWENWANFPAILFPWTGEDGQVEYQVRPDNPTEGPSGRPRKYVFRKGMEPVLWAVRPAEYDSPILIIEGTKQCLAGASYAPDNFGVYGIAGCRMWQIDGAPIPGLAVVDGREVVVILDADAADNPEVYRAGVELEQALKMEGATKVSFGRLPGGGKSGLDDVLATRPVGKRADYLARIITAAKPKPADAKPKPKKRGSQVPTGDDGRVTIVCNRDRLDVINDLTGAMLKRWNAVELFCHGGVISRRKSGGSRQDGEMRPVDRGSFHSLVQETARTVNENEGANGTTYTFAWPDPGTMAATMSKADQFATLDRISHAPFVRPDGSVVTEPGYDETTRTMLIPDEVFDGLKVPDDPSAEEIAAARELILTEWLGDFPFDSDTDRANVLALIVTPAIRGMVPKVPLAVVDGLQMGVGKNLLADGILTVYTGQAAEPMNWVEETDELRKQITAAFRGGSEFFVFDEAHTIEGAPLAQALTASTWQDRILGVSTMANFPNVITWISLGNQVQVRGDLTRRVYRIALRPTYANPQDRRAESFRHPGQSGLDLLSWTRENRRELMTAILTLVRAWFAQGQPRPKRGISFGSFEIWEKITGGIIEVAGMTGFLDNIKVWRSESDFDTQYWYGHLGWLRDQFGDNQFRTSDVKAKAMADPAGYLAPPNLDDVSDKGYGKALGEAYSRLRGRRYQDRWLDRVGFSHGHVSTWRVFESDLEPDAGPAPEPDPQPVDGPKGWLIEHTDNHVPNSITDPDCTFCPQPVDGPVDECGCSRTEKVYCHAKDCHGGEDLHNADSEPPPYNEHAEARGCETEPGNWATGTNKGSSSSRRRMLTPHSVTIEIEGPVSPELFKIMTGEPSANVVTFDLETGDAEDLYKSGPGYVRIGATATDDQSVASYGGTARDVAEGVTADIRAGRTITGHNIMTFDLPALVRSGTMTMPEVHQLAADGRLFDTLLAARFLDPPMARDKGVDAERKYDLGTLGVTHGLGEKLTDVSKGLAKKYGGWANIPIDTDDSDPIRAADAVAFQGYMVQDVELSRKLFHRLDVELTYGGRDYLRREHQVAAIATQISVNGFLVDQPLLTERVTEIQERKADAMRWLAAECGVPTADAKGKAHKSPLATKAGKAALETALRAAGATSIWTTPSAGEIQVSADHMRHLAQEYHHLPQVREIAKQVYRIVSARTVYETIQNSMCPDGRVHPKVSFKQATGRWSLTDPGLTVMGKRGGRHVERAVLLPDPGEVLISVDLSQVDMRAVAGLSQDQGYIAMLHREDPHTELALALFGGAKYREQAKAIGHGWNYGESLRRISEENEIDPALVRKFDTSMRERFPRLVEWREEVRTQAESGHLLDNGFGRLMRPDPQRAHTQGPALMGQGAARDLMMTGMLRLPSEILPMLRAQIHDEIVLSVPADQVSPIGRAVVDALSFEWRGVPIMADVSRAGHSWAGCYDKD